MKEVGVATQFQVQFILIANVALTQQRNIEIQPTIVMD